MFADLVKNIAEFLQGANIPAILILLLAFTVTFVENLFPPSPCDSILVMLGSLIGLGKVEFIPLLISATAGSAVGFIAMYLLGRQFGEKIIDSKRFKFINEENLEKPRRWFRKYGYTLIVINRFLPGTRAVISFFAGISNLKLKLTIILSAISALIWNVILIWLGKEFGENWEVVVYYMAKYGRIITIAVISAVVLYSSYRIYKYASKRKETGNENA